MSVEMILSHLGEEEHLKGAVVPPIFQTSLFVRESCRSVGPLTCDDPDITGYGYSRVANPTLRLAEKKLAALEHCDECKLFGSGMGAISAGILSAVESGSHVVCVDTVYGPTKRFVIEYLARFGVTHTIVDSSCTDSILDACKPETTLIVVESPSSIVFQFHDLRRIGAFCRERGITTLIDNTYAAGLLQQPADYGIDLIAHSGSKYFGGHSDIIAGVLCGSRDRIKKLERQEYELVGGAMAPFPAWLLLRGLRTLKVRMRAHEETANAVAPWLAAQPWVDQVLHISLPDFPQRDLFKAQMSGSGGLFSFIPKTQDPDVICRFVDALNVFQRGVSWGGFESLAVTLPMEVMAWGGSKWVVRLFCGLESAGDLIADLNQASSAF